MKKDKCIGYICAACAISFGLPVVGMDDAKTISSADMGEATMFLIIAVICGIIAINKFNKKA